MTDLDIAIQEAVVTAEWALVIVLLVLGVPAVFGLWRMVRKGWR